MTDKFTAVDLCPRCESVAVHPMRPPNPDPPKQVREPETRRIVSWGGRTVREDHDDGLDRWDERPYKTIRVCNRCGHEWGQA